jgi:SAM-dependent methyltransferase
MSIGVVVGVLLGLAVLVLVVELVRRTRALGRRSAQIQKQAVRTDRVLRRRTRALAREERRTRRRLEAHRTATEARASEQAAQLEVLRQEVGELKVEIRRQRRQVVNAVLTGTDPATSGGRGVAAADLVLPPVEIRMGGEHFRDDAAFVERAVRDVRILVEEAGLDERSRLLDWGCGAGRLAVGVKHVFGAVADYHGVDVQALLVDWAQENLADERTRFTRVDLSNQRYNPRGRPVWTIPGADASVDVFYAYSVFSHMQLDETAAYLREIARLLAPGARAVITAFVEDDVPEWSENPAGYGPLEWSGALHCVRFDRPAFERLVREAGLAVDAFEYGQETDGQSRYVLRPAVAAR